MIWDWETPGGQRALSIVWPQGQYDYSTGDACERRLREYLHAHGLDVVAGYPPESTGDVCRYWLREINGAESYPPWYYTYAGALIAGVLKIAEGER